MSLLVGLRGQTRETDGAGLREGITQQPGPFYNGNPSSIIWGNPPPSPLWRDDNGSPFFKTKYAGFGTSKPQQFGREEKQKESSEVVAEGKPPVAAKRSPILSESVPNVNSNPGFSPFTFGFPPHSSAASSSSPALGSEESGMSASGAAPSDDSFTGGSGSNEFSRRTMGAGGDGSDIRSWQIPSFQNERVKDVGAVTSATANLTLNDHGNNSKHLVDSKDRVEATPESSASSVTGFDFTGKFRSLGLGNPPRQPSVGRQDKPRVFVFGASLSSENESARAASPPSDSAIHSARPRPLKVKRGVLATKCKGPAADNGAPVSTTSSEGVHLSDFRSADGDFQHLKSTVGLDQPPSSQSTVQHENSAFRRFVPPSSRPSEQSNSESNGRFTSGKDQASSSAEHRPFFNFEFGKNNRSTGETNIRLEDSSAAEALLSASTAKIDASGSPLFSRNPNNTESGRFDPSSSPSHSLNCSVGDYTDNASEDVSGKGELTPGRVAMNGQATEDLSSELNLKLGLGCGEAAHEKKVFIESGVAGNPVGTQSSESGDSTHGGISFAARDEMKSTKENRGAESTQSSQFSTVSTSSSPGFLKHVKDAVSEKSGRPVEAAPRVRSEPDIPKAKPEPFVFGAARTQATSSRPRAMKTSSAFKLHGGSRSASPSQNSSNDGPSNGRAANSATSDLLSSMQEDSAPKRNAALEVDLNSLPFSFSAFNIGAAKPSMRVSAETGPFSASPPGQTPIFTPGVPKPSGVPSDVQRPIPGRMSSATGKGDPVDSEASGSASSSHFVFSAGTDQISSSRTDANAPATFPENKFINRFRRSVTIGGEEDTSATSEFSGVQSVKSQPSGTSDKTFEFRANIDGGGESSKISAARKKTYRAQAGRRQGRSRAPTKERPESFVSFDENSSNLDESGTPMDFSPQRYTPPDDVMPEIQQKSENAMWGIRSPSRLGLDVDEDWSHYFETEGGLGNLRNAADDPPVGTRSGPRDAWKEMAKSEDESTWWSGKENVPKKSTGRSGKWKRAVFDENHVPFAGRENTWNGIKLETANRPDSGASSSTPSGESSASSGGWGQFTFTTGSSNFSSTTSLLRRHARRIQRDKPSSGSEGMKSGTSKYKEESRSTPVFRSGTTSAAGTTSTMSRPAFAVDGRANVSMESGRGFAASKSGSWDPARVPGAVSSSRSKSWSSESSTSVGSLPRSEAAKPADPQIVGAAATEQVCEKWRLRGNQAYADGDFPKAEEYYSRGASSVLPNETSQSCIRASMLCYSNRAATRMVVGRMREALADCMRATAVDPNFLRVRLRAASCHLALGETECAALAFEECLRRVKEDDQLDSKVSSEASEGLRKSKQVDEYLVRAQEILAKGGAGDTPTALRLLNEALLSSPHSEKAIELKGRAFLVLRRYEDAVQICEQSLLSAERNHPFPNGDSAIHQLLHPAAGDTVKLGGAANSLKMWRWQLTAKAKFHLGRLEEALELLQKSVETSKELSKEGVSSGSLSGAEPSVLLIGIIRDLLRHKAAGNDAFQSGKHTEAVEHYTAALACNGDSRPFNAVCFCNRAAASQALGNIADAISDCSRAIALDPKYAKAISRRATLHEKVRDYGQSSSDLQKLVGLIESQHQQARAGVAPGWAGRSTTNGQQDLWQARERLTKSEEEMKKGHPLDHYMILGLEPTCSSNEIKKAYRKAALRHHPDKAGQFLGRSDSGDDGGTWKEVTDEVRSDAERLFKLIGEANAILSDNQKRSRYDSEEEFRKLRTRSSSAACGFSDVDRGTERGHSSSSRRPRERWDSWTGYSHQNQRWQSGPDAAQPDTYARRTRYGSNNHSRSNVDGGRWNDYDWDDM